MDANQAFQEVSLKHVNNMKLLRQVRGKQMRTRRELASWKAVNEELLNHEGPVYRAVGKAFVMEKKGDVQKKAEEEVKELSSNNEKFEKQAEFLMSKVRENEKQLGELMRNQRQ